MCVPSLSISIIFHLLKFQYFVQIQASQLSMKHLLLEEVEEEEEVVEEKKKEVMKEGVWSNHTCSCSHHALTQAHLRPLAEYHVLQVESRGQ